MALNQEQIRELRQRVIRMEESPYRPAECRSVTLLDGPLEGLAVLVSAKALPGDVIQFPYALLTEHVIAEYIRDAAGHWSFKSYLVQENKTEWSPGLQDLINTQRRAIHTDDDIPF